MAKKTSERMTATSLETPNVAQRAYEIWQREGCPDGRAMEHWFRAEAELAAESGTTTTSATAENLKIRGGRRAGTKTAEGQFQVAGR
jgi:hypothetical protein